MGRLVFAEEAYLASRSSRGISSDEHVTSAGEQKVKETGKLAPAVDPSVDALRRSLLRFDVTEDGKWEVTVGCPMDIEVSVDSTGSMGDNVDRAMKALPRTYELCAAMLLGYDPQLALGFFGDVTDKFVLNRPQFEMEADKIVNYLSLMNPEHDGGDTAEDPQYSFFASAFLTAAYTNRIGLKGYYFMCTDAPMHGNISPKTLERVFGADVWEALKDNGYQFSRQNCPDLDDVILMLHEKKHCFVLICGGSREYKRQYEKYFSNVISIYSTEYLPEFESAIIGLTEGNLDYDEIEDYLRSKGVSQKEIDFALDGGLLSVPVGAQRKLENESTYIPKAGDIFEKKTDLRPIIMATEKEAKEGVVPTSNIEWL